MVLTVIFWSSLSQHPYFWNWSSVTHGNSRWDWSRARWAVQGLTEGKVSRESVTNDLNFKDICTLALGNTDTCTVTVTQVTWPGSCQSPRPPPILSSVEYPSSVSWGLTVIWWTRPFPILSIIYLFVCACVCACVTSVLGWTFSPSSYQSVISSTIVPQSDPPLPKLHYLAHWLTFSVNLTNFSHR